MAYAEPVTVEETTTSVCATGATLRDDVGACVAVVLELPVLDVAAFTEHESPAALRVLVRYQDREGQCKDSPETPSAFTYRL